MSISGDGRETTDGGLCPVRNDLTRQYIDGVGDTSPRIFLSSIGDRVDFNRPFCLGFTMLTTNASNSAPLVSIVITTSRLSVFALVVDNAGVTLTFDKSSVTFPAPQFADGNPQQLQICANGTMATLYSNCDSQGSLPFATGSSTVDFSRTVVLLILRSVVTNETFQVSASYLALYIKIMHNIKEEFKFNCSHYVYTK